MNYIDEDTAFERWCENNYLPIQSQAIWKKLFKRFNRSGWSEWITVDNLTLMADVQIKREDSFIKYRDKLKDAGLIEYIRGKKGSPNKYKLISLMEYPFNMKVQNVVKSGVQSGVNNVVESVAQSVDITKLNKTKLNETEDIKKTNTKEKKDDYGVVGGFDEFWQAYPRKESKQSALNAFKKLKPNNELLAAMINALEIQKKSEQWQKDKGQFIPHPSTWLNQKRWEDEPEQKTQEEIYAEFDIKPFVLGVDDQ